MLLGVDPTPPTSEEREVALHCTFKPQTTRGPLRAREDLPPKPGNWVLLTTEEREGIFQEAAAFSKAYREDAQNVFSRVRPLRRACSL